LKEKALSCAGLRD